MTDDEKMAFVQQLYATTGAGDFDAAETMLTDDFFIIEAEGLPMAGEYRGKTAAARFVFPCVWDIEGC